MTTFVNLTEEDPAYYLVVILDELNGKEVPKATDDDDDQDPAVAAAMDSAFGSLIKKANYGEFLLQAFVPNVEKILGSENEETIEAAFNLVFSLLPKLGKDKKTLSKIVSTCTEALSKDKSALALTRLQLLSILFNILPDSNSAPRLDALQALLRYALATENVNMINLSEMQKISQWVEKWSLTPAEQVDLYLLVANICAAGHRVDLSQKMQYACLCVIDANKIAETAAIKEAATTLLTNAFLYAYGRMVAFTKSVSLQESTTQGVAEANPILLAVQTSTGVSATGKGNKTGPNIVISGSDQGTETVSVSGEKDAPVPDSFNLYYVLASKSVQSLLAKTDVYALALCYSQGDLPSFPPLKTKAAVSELFSQHNIQHDDIILHLRALTLCRLGMGGQTKSFSELTQALSCQDECELEETIIQAVVCGAVEATIDEASQTVDIKAASMLNFDDSVWKTLGSSMNAWTSNVGDVLSSLHVGAD